MNDVALLACMGLAVLFAVTGVLAKDSDDADSLLVVSMVFVAATLVISAIRS